MKRKYTFTIDFESNMTYKEALKLVDACENIISEANDGDFGSQFSCAPDPTNEEIEESKPLG